MSRRNTVVFTTSASVHPDAASTASRLARTCLVSAATPPSTISFFFGSRPTWPEVWTSRSGPDRTTWAWLYGPSAFGASGLATAERLIDPPRGLAPGASLDRDRLGQVARLVDVAAALHRHVVGEQLERHDREQRHEGVVGGRHRNHVVGEGVDVGVALGGDGEDLPPPRA